jgi:hypothetical protein
LGFCKSDSNSTTSTGNGWLMRVSTYKKRADIWPRREGANQMLQ